MFWKRKVLIAVSALVGSAIAGIVVYEMPPVYSSEALILIDSQKIPERYVASTVNTELQDRIANISQQILSTSRLKKIIDDFNLYSEDRKSLFEEEILEKMRGHINLKMEKSWTGTRPGAFRVGFEGPNPTVVSQVANRLTQLYIEENLRSREVQAEGTAEFINTQLNEAKKRLDELEVAVSAYKVKHNGELPQQESSISGELLRLGQEVENTRQAIHRAQADKATLQGTLGMAEATLTMLSQPRQAVVESGGANPSSPSSPAGPQLTTVDVLEARLTALSARYTDDHPDIKRLKQDLSVARQLQAQESRGSAGSPDANAAVKQRPAEEPSKSIRTVPLSQKDMVDIGTARQRVAAMKSQIVAEDNEIQARKADEQRISRQLASLQANLGKLPIREQEMAALTRDYEISKANYKSLLDKKLSADMSTDMEARQKSERFTVLDSARVPEKPIKPNRPLLGGLGVALSLGLGFLLAFGIEFRKDVLLGDWELPKEIPVLGCLPYIKISNVESSTPPLNGFRKFSRWRLAIVSSAILCIVGVAAGGAYLLWWRY
jgi:polysaccharide chain length determinant protein (PEP-CTERM system associated)